MFEIFFLKSIFQCFCNIDIQNIKGIKLLTGKYVLFYIFRIDIFLIFKRELFHVFCFFNFFTKNLGNIKLLKGKYLMYFLNWY